MLGAGFSLHCHLPSKLGLLVGSTSGLCLPATLGDGLHKLGQVAGGIQVTIQDRLARLATEGALGQGELAFHPPTPRAHLGRGKEPVGYYQPAAVPDCLVAEQTALLRQPGVGDRAGQTPVAQQAGDVELLDHHRAGRYASRKGRLEEGDQFLGDGFGFEQWGKVTDARQLSDVRVDDVLGHVAFHVGEEGAE
jgi:hypothetical protein